MARVRLAMSVILTSERSLLFIASEYGTQINLGKDARDQKNKKKQQPKLTLPQIDSAISNPRAATETCMRARRPRRRITCHCRP